MRNKTLLLITLSLVAMASGCHNSSTEQVVVDGVPHAVKLESLSETQQAQKTKAIAAKDKLFQTLIGELTASMQADGPAASISVCKTSAPNIAAKISEEMNVRIGRTSVKLRNSKNTSPDWAARYVTDLVEEPVAVALPKNELGILLPIHLNDKCIACHGATATIAAPVKEALAANYPDDTATGYSEGDLRGYFWVEVPANK